ncbi:hypothetical protein BDDG_12214 [Blastomyces dermatitidis ATCC 18188]|uniref:Uncharacterized protein n=1 Tax=Ajellomyces dermatitidis (strain ATCC 18188 / CBS 674.68) TaxID=653446 RepID=A0A0J9HF08_AJEDA|nr:hypothetical protein BDDG_12214 [Blastomyces dermatitidis ATCC 18188]
MPAFITASKQVQSIHSSLELGAEHRGIYRISLLILQGHLPLSRGVRRHRATRNDTIQLLTRRRRKSRDSDTGNSGTSKQSYSEKAGLSNAVEVTTRIITFIRGIMYANWIKVQRLLASKENRTPFYPSHRLKAIQISHNSIKHMIGSWLACRLTAEALSTIQLRASLGFDPIRYYGRRNLVAALKAALKSLAKPI